MAEGVENSDKIGNASRLYVRLNGNNAKRAIDSARNDQRFRRFIFNAQHFKNKGSTVEAIGNLGAEIVLDLNVPETAVPGRFRNFAGKLPWAPTDAPWTPEGYRQAGPQLLEEMAALATLHSSMAVDAVLAPTHMLGAAQEPWLPLDIEHFTLMRQKLDERQAHRVCLDYPIIAPLGRFRDPAWRRRVMDAIAGLPISTLWLRIGSGGDDIVGAVTHIIDATNEFRSLGHPIVLDMDGDLVALCVLAGGGVDALACGVGRSGGFNLQAWRRETRPPSPTQQAYLPGIDARLTAQEWQDFFFPETVDGNEDSRNIHHRFFSCVSTDCCSDDSSVFDDVSGHFMRQRALQIDEIEAHADQSGRFIAKTYLGRLQSRMRALDNLRFTEATLPKKIDRFEKKRSRLQESLSTHPGYLKASLPPAPPHRALPAAQRPPCADSQEPRKSRRREPGRPKPAKPSAPRDTRTPDLF